jgi:hypothetical protein
VVKPLRNEAYIPVAGSVRSWADPLSALAPRGSGELGPVCDGPALIDVIAITGATPPPIPAVAEILQTTEPSWYTCWDVTDRWLGVFGGFAASTQSSRRGDVVSG